ncbi:hypothetical protein BDR26DRAFT_858137 [Obelidium mucronatum]|nr:hypothetical protein BDR26DRAFT_858137 [Obelidium mucronatum]
MAPLPQTSDNPMITVEHHSMPGSGFMQPEQSSHSHPTSGINLLISAAEIYNSTSTTSVQCSSDEQSGRLLRPATSHSARNQSLHLSESNRNHPYRRNHPSVALPDLVTARTLSSTNGEMIIPNGDNSNLPSLMVMDEGPSATTVPPFLSSPQATSELGVQADLMGTGEALAESPIAAGEDEELVSPRNSNIINISENDATTTTDSKKINSTASDATLRKKSPPCETPWNSRWQITLRNDDGRTAPSFYLDRKLYRRPPKTAGSSRPQANPETVQDAKDLAAFAAWVTLKLIGRRWSLLMEQNGAGVSGTSSLHVGNSFATGDASSGARSGGSGSYSVFVNAIPDSAYIAGSMAVASGADSTLGSVSLPNLSERPPLKRYQAQRQGTLSSLSACIGSDTGGVTTHDVLQQPSNLTTSHTIPVSENLDAESEQPATCASPQGSFLMENNYAASPTSSPIMQAQTNIPSFETTAPILPKLSTPKESNTPLPSLNRILPSRIQYPQNHPSRQYHSQYTPSITHAHPFSQPLSRPQSYHHHHHQHHNQSTSTPIQLQIPTTSLSPPPKHTLPPAYISHYTSKLTRLATLTLLKTPTPPQTMLLALHLLRRLISTPKPLPASISTPTRMLLGCLMIADSLFGGERGVPSRVWSAIAQVSGLKEGAEDVDPGGGVDGKRLGLVAKMKKDVLVSLCFNLHGSVVGYDAWLQVLKDLLKEEESTMDLPAAQEGKLVVGSASRDMKWRTRKILEDLTVGEGKLGMGWKW